MLEPAEIDRLFTSNIFQSNWDFYGYFCFHFC